MLFLHLQCLTDAPDQAVEISAFTAAMGIPLEALRVVRPFDEGLPPDALDGVSGLTIGGSSLSVFHAIPRYAAFEAALREARRRRIPIFGACFGHQTLADVFGGKVIRDRGRTEYGSIEVRRLPAADADPIFSALPERFHAQAWHHDRVVRLPDGAAPLAENDAGLQAFGFPGESVWGVQFHPERTMETFSNLLLSRPDPPDRCCADIRATLRPTAEAEGLLRRFARFCADR